MKTNIYMWITHAWLLQLPASVESQSRRARLPAAVRSTGKLRGLLGEGTPLQANQFSQPQTVPSQRTCHLHPHLGFRTPFLIWRWEGHLVVISFDLGLIPSMAEPTLSLFSQLLSLLLNILLSSSSVAGCLPNICGAPGSSPSSTKIINK